MKFSAKDMFEDPNNNDEHFNHSDDSDDDLLRFIGYVYILNDLRDDIRNETSERRANLNFKNISDEKRLKELITTFYAVDADRLNLQYLSIGEVHVIDYIQPLDMYFTLYDKKYVIKFLSGS